MGTKSIIALALAATLVAGPVMAKNDKVKPLPSGLQQNYERGKELPEGWKKKLARGQILDGYLYDEAVILEGPTITGTVTVAIEDQQLVLDTTNNMILQVLR